MSTYRNRMRDRIGPGHREVAGRVAILAVTGLLFLIAPPGRAFAKEHMLAVDIIYTSDVHGYIDEGEAWFLNPDFPPPSGGGASATTYINWAREEAQRNGRGFLLVDSGDIFQGSPVGSRTKGTAVIEYMNLVGYDAMALGNHEFDEGRENAKRLVELADFPVLSANMYDTKTGKRADWVEPYVVFERGGVRIGVIGVTTEATSSMSLSENVAGVVFRPMYDELIHFRDVLRDEEKVDIIVVLMHAGLPYRLSTNEKYDEMLEKDARGELGTTGLDAMEAAHLVDGIDVFFGGDTHQGYDQPWEDPRTHTLVFEPYANGSSLGHVTFFVDPETRRFAGFETHSERGALITLLQEDIWPEPNMRQVIRRRVDEAEEGLKQVIGETEVYLGRGDPNTGLMGILVAEAMLEQAQADFAVQNMGGVRTEIKVGPITGKDIAMSLPFNNQVTVLTIPGQVLKDAIESRLARGGGGVYIAGGVVEVDPTRPVSDRIVSFTIGGEPLDVDRVYKIVTNSYVADGNSGFTPFKDVDPNMRYNMSTIVADAVNKYIRRHSPIVMRSDNRWREAPYSGS